MSRIIDVVFAANGIARRPQKVDEGAADCRAAPMPNMQEACRIRAHILDHNALCLF